MSKKVIIFIIFIFSILSDSYCQSNVSLNLTGIGVHVSNNPNSRIYENKLDSNGIFNFEPGAFLSFEIYYRENYSSVKITQGFYSDAAAQPAGMTYVGLRRRFFHKGRNQWAFSLGPVLTYRKSWSLISGYIPQTGYAKDGKMEFKLWGVFNIDYNYYLTARSDLSLSFVYGYSANDSYTITAGYRYWFNIYIKHPKKCNCGENYKRKKIKHWFK
jgi:hypothetical protein